MLASFVPMFLIAAAFFYLNRADQDAGTTFSWVTRASTVIVILAVVTSAVASFVIGIGFLLLGLVLMVLWRLGGNERFFGRWPFEAVDPALARGDA